MRDDGRAPAAEQGGEVILIEEEGGEAAASGEAGVDEAAGEADALEGAEGLLELVVAAHEERVAAEAAKAGPIDGVVVGRIVGFAPNGDPLVEAAVLGGGGGVPARSMTALGPEDEGREVALLFEGGRRDRPVVMGRMHAAGDGASAARRDGATATADGERLVLTAEKEIVLQCGKASITLTRAGKILIRGAYLLTRSSGVNRIQGGSVQIN
ncbi:DUF6484 domain-containing protein [Sorangium cellulosum]|uniref:DUF6484 domain-containing protein n=1 Tax=Sorangium cellulosum So0157-2 TaxID=1254432 RepID=S4Y1V3_SORCE|nr:DUF6484 domain-containing protein [Sorangium cellulosum]AGP38441.1 hypothetical protein SCE1572_30550 [Sorangium cellulosum So0157-2]